MKTTIYTALSALFLSSTLLMTTSCLEDGDETIAIENYSAIPDDEQAGEAPYVNNFNTNISNPTNQEEEYDGEYVIRLDMTGVWDPSNNDWMYLWGTGARDQNIWLTIDGKPKGFIIYNTSDDNSGQKVSKADLVFLVDNSGSMSDEANTIANDIMSWSQELERHGLDIRFGCVGYAERGFINGALDITSATELSEYLNYSSGTNRTMHYGGSNSRTLQTNANNMSSTGGECGGMAIQYADSYLNFRTGANRIYVNFTDEPNQPGNYSRFSTEYYKTYSNWDASKGTVHTVYSDPDTTYTEVIGSREKPWRISRYTGGTVLITNGSFTGVNLSTLPVSGAMQNSYIIRFKSLEELKDGRYHTVEIVIRSADGTVRAKRTFSMKFV